MTERTRRTDPAIPYIRPCHTIRTILLHCTYLSCPCTVGVLDVERKKTTRCAHRVSIVACVQVLLYSPSAPSCIVRALSPTLGQFPQVPCDAPQPRHGVLRHLGWMISVFPHRWLLSMFPRRLFGRAAPSACLRSTVWPSTRRAPCLETGFFQGGC